jgi:hypothetical protein
VGDINNDVRQVNYEDGRQNRLRKSIATLLPLKSEILKAVGER